MKFFFAGMGNMYDDLETITEAIIEADKLGFDCALMPDHYMWGARSRYTIPNRNYTLETWVTLSYLAGKTERIKLGTLVTPIPFRPPGMLAKMISTLDVLSGGRVVLGVGAGWSQVEFDGYSVWGGSKYRVDKTIEGLELILRLWTEDKVDFDGRFYKAKGAVLEPKPIQRPYPKLLFGSTGNRMIGLAGKYANLCYIPPSVQGLSGGESWGATKAKIMRAAERADRASEIAFIAGDIRTIGLYDADAYSRKVEEAMESGASYFLASFAREAGARALVKSMKRFSEDVMSSYM